MIRKIALIVLLLFAIIPGTHVPVNGAIQENSSLCTGIIKNNKLFIPLRSVFTDFGFSVDWNGNTNTVIIEKDSAKLTLVVEENRAAKKVMINQPILNNSRVYVPLRFASESLGADVEWNSKARAAIVSYGGKKIYVYPKSREEITYYSGAYNINGKKISVNVVQIPLHAAVPDMVVAGGTVGNREELASMAKRSEAVVAINGTFFNAYSNPPLPYGNIIKNGRIVHRGSVGTTCGFYVDGTAKFGHVEFRRLNDDLGDYGWEGIRTAVGAGPRLLTDGKISVDPAGEGFTSKKILNMCMARSAVGVKADGTVILVTTVASIENLAQVMKNLGAHNAMNLDGGASSGLWYKGKYITPPGRLLSNSLVFTSMP